MSAFRLRLLRVAPGSKNQGHGRKAETQEGFDQKGGAF